MNWWKRSFIAARVIKGTHTSLFIQMHKRYLYNNNNNNLILSKHWSLVTNCFYFSVNKILLFYSSCETNAAEMEKKPQITGKTMPSSAIHAHAITIIIIIDIHNWMFPSPNILSSNCVQFSSNNQLTNTTNTWECMHSKSIDLHLKFFVPSRLGFRYLIASSLKLLNFVFIHE